MNKSFTLIELLVVVAIIGILAAVGIPIFQGFLTTAKINATTENHNRARDMMTAYFAQCSAGASSITLNWPDGGRKTREVDCYQGINTTYNQAIYFGHHFVNSDWVNPYTKSIDLKTASGCGALGQTRLWHTGQSGYFVTITTNVGTEDGKNKCITNTILTEYTQWSGFYKQYK